MLSRRLRITGIVLVAIAAAAVGTGIALLGGNTICPGVRMAGVDLGGLTREQAEFRLQGLAGKVAEDKVTLRYAAESTYVTVADLGGGMNVEACARAAWDVGRTGSIFTRIGDVISARRHGMELPVTYSFDERSASESLHVLAKKIDRQPVNARLEVQKSSVRVIPEKPGVRVDIERSLAEISRTINSGGREVNLVVATAVPEVTADDLKGIDGVLASYSTPYKPWERDRTYNLKLACKAIDATIVEPGQVFSYNEVVGPRLGKHGYRNAPMFVKGEVEPGLGGGVCQVSTTVYNAALLSDMKIISRSHHSRPVVYAPVGRDATVAYPYPDLKFENTSGSRIYILASVGDRTVDVGFLGRKTDGQEVLIVAEGHSVIRASLVERVDEELQPGKRVVREPGRAGHRVSTYRIVKSGGKVVKRELISTDYYRPESRVVAVPPSAPSPAPI